MKGSDAEIVIQWARKLLPQARPRIITDNGPQFIAGDFKEFIRLWQTPHVFCSPHYPRSNGKLERYHHTGPPAFSIIAPSPKSTCISSAGWRDAPHAAPS
jgi:transposase InsO family protein